VGYPDPRITADALRHFFLGKVARKENVYTGVRKIEPEQQKGEQNVSKLNSF
jgi:hypothetical protein